MSASEKWMNALFQSITLRSGGFSTVDFATVEQATIAVMMVWMFIGAAPGGTGGGIKVTTLAVLAAALPALVYNQPRAVLMRRAIPNEIVYRAATIVTVAGFITAVAVVLMLATHNLPFHHVVFEVVSAVGTVGLSLGITESLQPIGKWVMIALMFIGRARMKARPRSIAGRSSPVSTAMSVRTAQAVWVTRLGSPAGSWTSRPSSRPVKLSPQPPSPRWRRSSQWTARRIAG
jgi:Trk-type K+ transport system membrane component